VKKIALATAFGAMMGLSTLAHAQQGPTSGVPAVGPDFQADSWTYGPRYDVSGEIEVWNPVRAKMEAGEHVIGITIRTNDPYVYCAAANSGYDFTWTEMQHEQNSWADVADMWVRCPRPQAMHGTRIAYTTEKEFQQAFDAGAMVVMVPTIDTVEEAQEAVNWTYFPPMGRHSSGGGQGPGFYNNVPGGYRATFNRNVVLILMIETLQGVENAREIAALDGVTALFAASGDIGNFSGYAEGQPEYESLISEIIAAAQAAGKPVCGPSGWRWERPEFTCFQGPGETGLMNQGAQLALTPP